MQEMEVETLSVVQMIELRDKLNRMIVGEPEIFPPRYDTLNQDDYFNELHKSVLCAMKAMSHMTYDVDAVITHHGKSIECGDNTITLSTHFEKHLKITIQRTRGVFGVSNKGNKVEHGYSQKFWLANFGILEKTLCARLLDVWNEHDGSQAAVGVFSVPPPPALADGYKHYTQITDHRSREWHPRAWTFDAWFKKQYEAERKMYDEKAKSL